MAEFKEKYGNRKVIYFSLREAIKGKLLDNDYHVESRLDALTNYLTDLTEALISNKLLNIDQVLELIGCVSIEEKSNKGENDGKS